MDAPSEPQVLHPAVESTPEGVSLASGGGNATAAGVSFQHELGALFISYGLAGRRLDPRLSLGGATVQAVRFETEAPVDDILIGTHRGGHVYVQAKTSISLSTKVDSELGKTAEQFVRQWFACSQGDGRKGWNHPVNPEVDRFVLAVGQGAPTTISTGLAEALARRRERANNDTTPQSQRDALDKFSDLLRAAWTKHASVSATDEEVGNLLNVCAVLRFDFTGPDLNFATEMLSGQVEDPAVAAAAFFALATLCVRHSTSRTGGTIEQFRREMEGAGVSLLAPPDYRSDVQALRDFTARMRSTMAESQSVRLSATRQVHVARQTLEAASLGLHDGSLLLVGEPGAGKTGVLLDLAEMLTAQGSDVVVLPVDRLPVFGLDGLRSELGLAHPIRDVLNHWPGSHNKRLFIDGLDASRGSPGAAVMRALLAEVIDLKESGWNVVATIRSFDLRLGQQFRNLFRGKAPDAAYAIAEFSDVRHVVVRPWNDDEFAQVTQQAPELAAVLTSGGKRLTELAAVPFNTQMIAELLESGGSVADLRSVSSQAQLLQTYWTRRVESVDGEAKALLTVLVEQMATKRALRASKPAGAGAVEALLQAGVLVEQKGGRYVAFRHNILFDYAASKLYLNPYEPERLKSLLGRNEGDGLLLAPALGFALQELWTDQDDREPFWKLTPALVAESEIDLISRGVAAHLMAEMPATESDIAPFVKTLRMEHDAARVLSNVVNSLSVRNADALGPGRDEPWFYLLAELSTLAPLLQPLHSLLFILSQRFGAGSNSYMGLAARNLLAHAFAQDTSRYNGGLVRSRIGFVADTFLTDENASHILLERVLSSERLQEHGHVELPALADQIVVLSMVDAELAVSMYSAAFGFRSDTNRPTVFRGSEVLPLKSTQSQDFEMARWSLSNDFGAFLSRDPVVATRALIQAVQAFIASQHPLQPDGASWQLDLQGFRVRLVEDHSSLWAWNPLDEHPDTLQSMTQSFVKWLGEAPPEVVAAATHRIMAENQSALLWARLLMAASQRPAVFAPLLWALASNEHVLLCRDTRKDAVDALVAFLPLRSAEERQALAQSISAFDYSGFPDPAGVQESLKEAIFHVPSASAEITDPDPDDGMWTLDSSSRQNPRPFAFTSSVQPVSDDWWLREQGVAVDAVPHRAALDLGKQVAAALGLKSGQPPPKIADLPAALAQLIDLQAELARAQASGAQAAVVRTVEGNISDGVTAVLASTPEVDGLDPMHLESLEQMTLALSTSVFPIIEAGTEAQFERFPGWGAPAPRVDAVGNLYRLHRIRSGGPVMVARLRELAMDSHPAVRLSVAQHLATLWNSDREAMWAIANRFVVSEMNQGVLVGFVNGFLFDLRTLESERVEEVVVTLNSRLQERPEVRDGRDSLTESIARLVTGLHVWNGRSVSGELLRAWAGSPGAHAEQLRTALFTARNAMVAGYDRDTAENCGYRTRSQAFLRDVVEHAAAIIRLYLETSNEEEREDDAGVKAAALVVDYACNALYFASGAFKEAAGSATSHAIETDTGRSRMLRETEDVLVLLAEVGASRTLHHLVQLLAFLLPAAPALSFDVLSHAFLVGGKRQAYQLDPFGAETCIALLGRCLADYREVFNDAARRRVYLECLELYVDAGWPSARRLLYSLVDALQ